MGKQVAHLRLERVNVALTSMNAPLRAAYIAIGQHFAQGLLRETYARYEVGKLVREVMDDEDKYGENAVGLLAAALGVKADRLYDAAKVARLWTAKEFAAFVEKPDLHRMPLSFSHLVVLAEVADEDRRAELVTLARAEGLTSRELQDLTVEKKRSPTAAREPMKFLRQSARLIDTLIGGAVAVRSAAAALVNTPEERKLVVAALDSYRAAHAELETTLRVLQEALVRSSEAGKSTLDAHPQRVTGLLWGSGGGQHPREAPKGATGARGRVDADTDPRNRTNLG